jgi:hemoglobin
MRDIQNREDIMLIMHRFYLKLLGDGRISYLFTEVIHLDLEAHFPVLADFWETILFGVGKYSKNTMQVHLDLHQKSPLNKEHFTIWLDYFANSVDELFDGVKAQEAKSRAQSIASVMLHKVS